MDHFHRKSMGNQWSWPFELFHWILCMISHCLWHIYIRLWSFYFFSDTIWPLSLSWVRRTSSLAPVVSGKGFLATGNGIGNWKSNSRFSGRERESKIASRFTGRKMEFFNKKGNLRLLFPGMAGNGNNLRRALSSRTRRGSHCWIEMPPWLVKPPSPFKTWTCNGLSRNHFVLTFTFCKMELRLVFPGIAGFGNSRSPLLSSFWHLVLSGKSLISWGMTSQEHLGHQSSKCSWLMIPFQKRRRYLMLLRVKR